MIGNRNCQGNTYKFTEPYQPLRHEGPHGIRVGRQRFNTLSCRKPTKYPRGRHAHGHKNVPTKSKHPKQGQTLPHHLWLKSVLYNVHSIRKCTKALRRLAALVAATTLLTSESITNTESPHHQLWLMVTTPLTLRTVASPLIWNLEALSLTDVRHDDDDATSSPNLTNRVNVCFKAHMRATRLLLKHVRNKRRLEYGKPLLRMFLKKPKVALQSILRTEVKEENTQPLPTDLSILRDDASCHLLVDPAEVIAQV